MQIWIQTKVVLTHAQTFPLTPDQHSPTPRSVTGLVSRCLVASFHMRETSPITRSHPLTLTPSSLSSSTLSCHIFSNCQTTQFLHLCVQKGRDQRKSWVDRFLVLSKVSLSVNHLVCDNDHKMLMMLMTTRSRWGHPGGDSLYAGQGLQCALQTNILSSPCNALHCN